MPLSRKEKQASKDEGPSLGKKLKNIFSKDKNTAGETQYEPPRAEYTLQQGAALYHANRPAPDQPRPYNGYLQSPQPGVGYRSPSPQIVILPQQEDGFYQQPPLRSGSALSFHSTHGNNGYRQPNPAQPRMGGQYLVPQNLPLQRFSRPTTPSGSPQVIIVQVPKNNVYVDGDDDSPEIVYVLPSTQDRQFSRRIEFDEEEDDYPVTNSRRLTPIRRLSFDSDSSGEQLFVPQANFVTGRGVSRNNIPTTRFVDEDDTPSLRAPSPPMSTEPETEPNLNRRYDYLPENMVPFWYNKRPSVAPSDSPGYLCATCRRIDLLELFRQPESAIMPKPRDYIVLGSLQSMLSRQNCGLCKLVSRIVALDTGIDLPKTMSEEEKTEVRRARLLELLDESYFLCPIRFETTYKSPALYICSSKDVAEASKQSSAIRPRGSMAIRPLHRTEPNLGRMLMKPDQIDFEWIRERMRLCDERDVGKLRYWHGVGVRAIDVESLKIIDLDHGDRYATLSYTWGNCKQLLMTKANEHYLRNGGLATLWDHYVPKTIRDAVTLTREIGERYLWVDALCIRQDDEDDKNAQIQEMGDIYRNSILTICACCGDDADYGLPGIEPETRKTQQAAVVVGNFVVGNAVHDSSSNENITWDTRAWTLQEKCLSQRKLQIYDTCVRWWCWHTITAEDENCRHTFWKEGTAHRGMHFFKTEHDLVVSKIKQNSNMDIYAFIVSDYTARGMTHQTDAEKALIGVWKSIDGILRGKFVAGLPDTELAASLLWCPLGSSKRRLHPETGKPLFPSWSWLGWIGHAAYPWLVERSMPMSEDGSPLLWRNHPDAPDEDQGFTGEDYRMNGAFPNGHERRTGQPDRWKLDDTDGWTHIDMEDEARRFLHPVLDVRRRQFDYFWGDGLELQFGTLSAQFTLSSEVRVRAEKHDYLHNVHYVRVLDERGFCAGFIYVPDPATLTAAELTKYTGGTGSVPREFIALSRASTISNPRIGAELLHSTPVSELHSVYSMSHMVGMLGKLKPSNGDESNSIEAEIDEKAQFDTRLYDATTPWCLFNVMMIETVDDVSYRVAIGMIHVAAFMGAEPSPKLITLD